jgi:hypothetical protein
VVGGSSIPSGREGGTRLVPSPDGDPTGRRPDIRSEAGHHKQASFQARTLRAVADRQNETNTREVHKLSIF